MINPTSKSRKGSRILKPISQKKFLNLHKSTEQIPTTTAKYMHLDKQSIASIFSDNKTMSTRSKTQKKDSPQKISKRQKKEMRKDAQDQKYLEEAEALQKDIVVMERELRQAGVKFDSVLPSNPLEEMEEQLDSDSDGGDDPYHELQRMKEKFELTQIMYEHHQETIQKASLNLTNHKRLTKWNNSSG